MIETIEAEDAWWPPTFTPSAFGRRWLAWWIIQLESHNSRCSINLRCSYWVVMDHTSREVDLIDG